MYLNKSFVIEEINYYEKQKHDKYVKKLSKQFNTLSTSNCFFFKYYFEDSKINELKNITNITDNNILWLMIDAFMKNKKCVNFVTDIINNLVIEICKNFPNDTNKNNYLQYLFLNKYIKKNDEEFKQCTIYDNIMFDNDDIEMFFEKKTVDGKHENSEIIISNKTKFDENLLSIISNQECDFWNKYKSSKNFDKMYFKFLMEYFKNNIFYNYNYLLKKTLNIWYWNNVFIFFEDMYENTYTIK